MILQTDYIRRIWTGLSTDDWGQADLQEGDVIYLMDASECWVGGEGMMYQLPDLGGGGGGGINAISGTAVSIGNTITIPDGHHLYGWDNLVIYPLNPDATYFSTAGRFFAFYSAAWQYSYGGYSLRSTTTNWKPTTLAVTSGTYDSYDHDTGVVTYKFNNANTMGLLPSGTECAYIWWEDPT